MAHLKAALQRDLEALLGILANRDGLGELAEGTSHPQITFPPGQRSGSWAACGEVGR